MWVRGSGLFPANIPHVQYRIVVAISSLWNWNFDTPFLHFLRRHNFEIQNLSCMSVESWESPRSLISISNILYCRTDQCQHFSDCLFKDATNRSSLVQSMKAITRSSNEPLLCDDTLNYCVGNKFDCVAAVISRYWRLTNIQLIYPRSSCAIVLWKCYIYIVQTSYGGSLRLTVLRFLWSVISPLVLTFIPTLIFIVPHFTRLKLP
jgi:hypothetical protein